MPTNLDGCTANENSPVSLRTSLNRSTATLERTEVICNEQNIDDLELPSDHRHVRAFTYGNVGKSQVYLKHLQFAPPWIIGKADAEEHDNSCLHAYTLVEKGSVARNPNVINVHTV